MKILAFDSTARVASVAVCENERTLAHYTIDNGKTQSELLLPMAESILKSLSLDFSDIDLYAVSVGPGSFTGVRIGASLVKGLSFGTGRPCVAVSTLEALAENLSGLDGYIVPVMDARRGQTYTALFESSQAGISRISADEAVSFSALAERLAPLADKKIYLVGDGYDIAKESLFALGISTEITPFELRLENATSVARVGFRLFNEGKSEDDLTLSPTYLRMPQAERERLERLATQKSE